MSIVLALITSRAEPRYAALVKRQAFFALGLQGAARAHLLRENGVAKFERSIANYGERDAQIRWLVVLQKGKDYEDNHNVESVPGDGGISEPL
jgi:hypothetical protein